MGSLRRRVSMQISSWNINGYKSRILGNKLADEDFIEEIKGDLLVSLVETHVRGDNSEVLSIPGFTLIATKNRCNNSKSKKGSGGLAVFAKHSFSNHITQVKNDNEDTLWVKVSKNFTKENEDTYIGTVYMRPYKSNEDNTKKIPIYTKRF